MSGSNVIPRRARPGPAGLRPHTCADGPDLPVPPAALAVGVDETSGGGAHALEGLGQRVEKGEGGEGGGEAGEGEDEVGAPFFFIFINPQPFKT